MKRNDKVLELADRIHCAMMDLKECHEELEGVWGYSKEAKRLDKITGDAYSLSEDLFVKAGGRNG